MEPRERVLDAIDGTVAVDAVVTHHRDGFRSGVARFNELLAERLAVPLLALGDDALAACACPLLSFKVAELTPGEEAALEQILRRATWSGELYLHDYRGLSLEDTLIARARRVHCGNHEIYAEVRRLATHASVAWTPGLILDERGFAPTEVSVFSFGMAHKIQVEAFARLRELLDASGRSYGVYVSAANHETASMRDAELIFRELQAIFPENFYFLGNVSDLLVVEYLRRTTFFAAFFPRGVRANNTSVASALEQGAVVLTNLDEHSPPEYVHMENVIDIRRCHELPSDRLVLAQLGARAAETGRERGWHRLVERLRPDAPDAGYPS